MILSPTSVWSRAGQNVDITRSHLLMCVEESIATKLRYALKIDTDFAQYLFAYVFEDSTTCGESGVHQFMGTVDLASEFVVAGYPTKMTPVKAWLLITIEEYNDLRLRRKQWEGRFRNTHPFPEFAHLEGRA